MKRPVLYLRVSTIDQTTANQERALRGIASRMGCKIVKVYKDPVARFLAVAGIDRRVGIPLCGRHGKARSHRGEVD